MKLVNTLFISTVTAQSLGGFSGFQFGNNFEAGNVQDQKVTLPPTTTLAPTTTTEAGAVFDVDYSENSQDYEDVQTAGAASDETERISDALGSDAKSFHRLRSIATFYHPDYYTVSHAAIWKTIKRYGCWCWPNGKLDGRTLTKGKYAPMDAPDKACQSLYECYRCVRTHHENKGGVCDPIQTRYNMKLKGEDWAAKDTSHHHATCRNEDNTCERDLCECDRRFSEQYRNAVSLYDEKHHQVLGSFNPEAQCQKPLKISFRTAMFQASTGQVQCCGVDPTQGETYRESANQKCCPGANKSFNPYYSECCVDTVVPIGSCLISSLV